MKAHTILDVVDDCGTTVHWTIANWPMVGVSGVDHAHGGANVRACEPWEARELAGKLRLLADRLLVVALAVDGHRILILADSKHGGEGA